MYNSALKSKIKDDNIYLLSEEYNTPRCNILKHNMCDSNIPEVFKTTDCIYSDIAWVNGFEVFRDKSPFTGNYEEYITNIINLVNTLGKPAFITCSKSVAIKLIKGVKDGAVYPNFRIHSSDGTNLVVLNYNKKVYQNNSVDLLEFLQHTFKCCLDFSSGYGEHLLGFKRFIASDVNAFCLGYLKNKVERSD